MSHLQQFLDEYRSANTRNAYRYVLRLFFTSVYGAGDVARQADRFFREELDYGGDVKFFLSILRDRPQKSVTMMLVSVNLFLMMNDVELFQKFWWKV